MIRKIGFFVALALMSSSGCAQEKDDLDSIRKAAEQGNADAQSNLGVMYANGKGVAQDDQEAVKWYRKAAEQGYARAQFNLGHMYDQGMGVTQDYIEAHKWVNLAAA